MLQAGLLAIWACLTWPFLLLTREQTVGFAASANLAVGVIVYYNSENGLLELGRLPQILFLGVLGLLLGRYAQRRYRLFNSAVLPQVSRRALQAKRFLRASLLCCGFIWGSAIAFAVLPKEHLRDFLRSLGGGNLVIEGTTEYAVRMALWTFTLIGFFIYFLAADLDGNLRSILGVGGFMFLIGIALGVVGFHLSPPHPWEFESASCVTTGLIVVTCGIIYNKEANVLEIVHQF